jgi:hypothetical protein
MAPLAVYWGGQKSSGGGGKPLVVENIGGYYGYEPKITKSLLVRVIGEKMAKLN